MVIIPEIVAGEREDKRFYKWEKMTTHTGRRSMICNMYLSGIPPQTIMKFSGHKSVESFMTYLNLNNRNHIQIAKDSVFFKNAEGYLKVV